MFKRLALSGLLLLAACAGPVKQAGVAPVTPPPAPQPQPPAPAPAPARAADARLEAVGWADWPGWAAADPEPARAAFVASCTELKRREDTSGLTQKGDWDSACAAAAAAAPGTARALFEAQFTPVTVAAGDGYATGYFELELAGSRTQSADYPYPLYRVPPDLVEVDLGQFSDSLKGRKIRGRVQGRQFVPYPDRAAIEAGALNGRGLELAYAKDPYELFFLEIQGSGRLRLPDGQVMRVGYAGQNGRDYLAIGRVLRDRGVFERGQASMENILGWLRTHPDEAPGVMNLNRSYVFFRELTGPGPIGAMGIALTPEVSAAADPAFVPLGAPVLLMTQTSEGPFARLMIAQDTGGAIKGANRFDIFFGAGDRARALANVQANKARAVILLPRPAAERILGPRP